MAIIKKTTINNTIFKELNDKYPTVSADNGVAYKQKLDYLTFETDFMESPNFRMLRQKYGNDIIAVIFYLRTKMCKNGWKVRIDGDTYEYLIYDCAYNCCIDQNKVRDILQDLIQHKIFFSVQDTSVEEGIWLTCPQQIYNYEMACNNRQLSRGRNAKKRKQHAEQRYPSPECPLNSPQSPWDFPETANNIEPQNAEDYLNELFNNTTPQNT